MANLVLEICKNLPNLTCKVVLNCAYFFCNAGRMKLKFGVKSALKKRQFWQKTALKEPLKSSKSNPRQVKASQQIARFLIFCAKLSAPAKATQQPKSFRTKSKPPRQISRIFFLYHARYRFYREFGVFFYGEILRDFVVIFADFFAKFSLA